MKHEGLTLYDIRDQDNVGADATDQNGRYYELKAHAGGLEDYEGLQPSSFLLAQREKTNFVLAVVTGLEEGYESQIRLLADPLKQLDWQPEVDIQLRGLSKVAWNRVGDALG